MTAFLLTGVLPVLTNSSPYPGLLKVSGTIFFHFDSHLKPRIKNLRAWGIPWPWEGIEDTLSQMLGDKPPNSLSLKTLIKMIFVREIKINRYLWYFSEPLLDLQGHTASGVLWLWLLKTPCPDRFSCWHSELGKIFSSPHRLRYSDLHPCLFLFGKLPGAGHWTPVALVVDLWGFLQRSKLCSLTVLSRSL